MKLSTPTPNFVAALLLTASCAFGETPSNLRAMITLKQSELNRVQGELTSLKKQLSTATPQPVSNSIYKVQAGDTVSSIARRHKMSYSHLVTLNQLTDPSMISIGQKLKVRSESNLPPIQAKKASAPAKSKKYTVKQGETFYTIARINGLSVGKLKELNPGINASRIMVGQSLKVAGLPAPRVTSAQKVNKPKTSRSSVPIPSNPEAPTLEKSSTTAITRSATPSKPTSEPSSTRKSTSPQKPSVKEVVATAPAPPKKEEVPMPSAPKRISSVILTNEIGFNEFAKKHGTNTRSLNALNGWNLPKATVLARGSEIFVPQ